MKFKYSDQDYFGSKGKQERTATIREVHVMRKEYDFSKSFRNPYEKHLKKQVTLRLGTLHQAASTISSSASNNRRQ